MKAKLRRMRTVRVEKAGQVLIVKFKLSNQHLGGMILFRGTPATHKSAPARTV